MILFSAAVFFLVPILVVGGIIALIVKAVGGRRSHPGDTGESLRRFFQYSFLLGAYLLVMVGASGLLAEFLPGGRTVVRDDSSLARAVSFLVVGTPVLYGLAIWTRRRFNQPHERESLGWALFAAAASIVSLLMASFAAFQVLNSVLDSVLGSDTSLYRADQVARAMTWGAGWYGLWRLTERYGYPARLQFERIAGSGIGLFGLVAAVWLLLSSLLRSVYDTAFGTPIADDASSILRFGFVGLAVSGSTWFWYWLRHTAKAEPTPIWRGYVALVGVLGGLLTIVIASSTGLFATLRWFFGNPESSSAVRHFDLLPEVATAAAIGLAIWGYHRATLAAAVGLGRTEQSRTYEYLVAGIGLVTAAGGITTLLFALFGRLSPVGIAGDGTANDLVAAITLLIAGGPLWWMFWSRIQSHVLSEPDHELTSSVRRVFLFTVFGVGGFVAVVNLIIVIFIGLDGLLEGTSGETLREARVPLALVLTMGVVAWYHWTVFTSDRINRPAQTDRVRLREVVVIGGYAELDQEISVALGIPVRSWRRLGDLPTGSVDAAALTAHLEGIESERALVIIGDQSHEIVPYEER